MDLNTLFDVAERARGRRGLSSEERRFVRDVVPVQLASFPQIALPKRIQHPGGFVVSGAPVGTFVRSALLIAGQKALGARYRGSRFYETVERDLGFRIMRSHFHHGYPKGTHCCVQCTLAVYPVLEHEAIRYFDCAELAETVRRIIKRRQWRFSRPVNPKILSWALQQASS